MIDTFKGLFVTEIKMSYKCKLDFEYAESTSDSKLFKLLFQNLNEQLLSSYCRLLKVNIAIYNLTVFCKTRFPKF